MHQLPERASEEHRELSRIRKRFEDKCIPEPNSGCWIWIASLGGGGYGKMFIRGKLQVATHISLLLDGRPLQDGQWALHKCDNKLCVNPDHLFPGTAKDNTRDAVRKLRMAYGERVWCSKLNAESIKTLFELDANGYRKTEIAARIGISVRQVYALLNGEAWKSGYIGERK